MSLHLKVNNNEMISGRNNRMYQYRSCNVWAQLFFFTFHHSYIRTAMKNEPVFESKQQLNDLLGETKVKEFETLIILK